MKKIAACALLACVTATFLSKPVQGSETTPLPGTVLAGQGTMRFFGLEVYQARLWVSPGFAPERYGEQFMRLVNPRLYDARFGLHWEQPQFLEPENNVW